MAKYYEQESVQLYININCIYYASPHVSRAELFDKLSLF